MTSKPALTSFPQQLTALSEPPIANQRAVLLPESVIFGRSAMMQPVRQNLARLGGNNIPVLIQGESGTGKQLIARTAA